MSVKSKTLNTHTKKVHEKCKGKIIWPDNDGCKENYVKRTLYPGDYVDRFGLPFGNYLGVVCDYFTTRSLPYFGILSNECNNELIKVNYKKFYNEKIRDKAPNKDQDYHLYKVKKPFDVSMCTVAPAFGFPGGGTQYKTEKNIQYYIDNGYLQEIEYNHFPFYSSYDDMSYSKSLKFMACNKRGGIKNRKTAKTKNHKKIYTRKHRAHKTKSRFARE